MTEELRLQLERHEAFWKAEEKVLLKRVSEHRPLGSGGGRGIPLANGERSQEGQEITPELIDPQLFYGEGSGPANIVQGDFIAGGGPPGLCWTEAFVGCPVRIVTGGPWAEPIAANWRRPAEVVADERWLEKLVGFVDLLVERADGRWPVVQPLFRGPIDMMASALGHEEMCLALVAEPEASGAFLDRCADIFLEAANRRLAHTPPFEGGYLSGYGIWAPGTVVRTQIDNAAMLSPEVYRERVLPYDRKVIESFDFPLIHLHSVCMHVVDALLEVEALKAIQVSVDFPGGPLAEEIMPTLEKVAGKKSLIVTGPVTESELEGLVGLADKGSICISVALVKAGSVE